ncbi:MAG: bifunctional UDP-3-O-[3-hydroxymyristoyl] N-acetylglucosamine deacetylase/3-hydroxyacyl-ACP dehydratase [Verrucomicrobiota bacterium JB022]|nr:bifunctional UDP-3-O-[3-hydroxymyristoyl] N-acetylglucosamine deacetylase/3-hydroxyacyl-ACP dehydratase [Verrucomicrobiota bacterium JB022]
MKQRTILREVATHGKALHTGQEVHLTLKPAPVGHGITFRRVDLYGKPEVKPRIEFVADQLVRSTDISAGHAKLHTIEHIMSALIGCGVDNCVIELDASEPPILDGSARHFVELIDKAEIVEQDAPREYYEVKEPISISDGNRSIIALPHDGFRVTCTSTDDRGIHTQHLTLDIDPEVYRSDVAAARTFTIYEDIEPLLKMGKIQGGSLDSAIVIKGNQILSKEGLRFEDEFVRHKILDIVGDLALLGKRLKAHIIAVRTGHKLNADLTKKLYQQMKATEEPPAAGPKLEKPTTAPMPPSRPKTILPHETELRIRRILDMLPHAYPFVMIDRVVEFISEYELKAIKNVTINEPYFVGHYPGNPVMPAVLQIEAMAQAAGLVMLRHMAADGKVALFMSADKVKFRRAVIPGDQLEIIAKIVKVRGERMAHAACECRVDGKVVSAAELSFMVVDVPEEGL